MPDRPPDSVNASPAMTGAGALGRRVTTGLLLGTPVGLALGLLEVLFVVGGKPLAFDTAGERVRFAFCLLGLHLGAGGVLGAIGGLVGHCVALGAARLGDEQKWTLRLSTLLATPAVIAGAVRLFSGRRMMALRARPLLIVLAVVAALAALHIGFVAAHKLLGVRRKRARAALLAAAVAGAIGLHLLDDKALPRLYLPFHVGLEALEVFALLLGAALVLRRSKLPAAWPAIALGLVALASGRWALRQLSFWPALRAVAFEETTAARNLLGVASALGIAPRAVKAPPPMPPRPAPVAAPVPSGPRVPDADVFLITVDAMRADRLQARTAPRMTALAAEGARFDRAYSQVPHTSFSITSLLTGKFIHSLAAIGEPLDAHETLADLFKRERYKTAAFFPPSVFFIDHDRFAGLERDAFRFEYVKYEYMAAPGRTDQVIDFLEAEKPKRVFVWVHYFDPHEPYDLHAPPPGEPALTESSTAIERYDGEVRFVDAEVGRLCDWIRAHRPGAIIAFTADHGEEFGEHGGRYHGTTLYEEQVRVPLFITGPEIVPRRILAPVGLVDVAPTLLSLSDMMAPVKMRGRDLSPWMGRAPAPEDRVGPTFAEINAKKMIARGDERLICDVSRDFCELYDLGADPAEQHNLAGRAPERMAPLRAQLDEWMGGHSRFERDPAQGDKERAQRALERCRLGDRSAAPEVAKLLAGPDLPLADLAARSLLRLPDEPAIHEAIFAAARARSDDTLLAALALRAGDRTLADPLARISERKIDPLPPSVLGEVAVALAAQGHPAAIARLRAALEVVDDEELERRILRTLGQMRGGKGALQALLAHLERSVRTRVETVRAIGDLHDRRAVGPLLDTLDEERYVTARGELAKVLGELGDKRAVPALGRLLRSETEAVVVDEVAVALVRLGAVRAAGGVELGAMKGWSCAPRGRGPGGCAPPLKGATLPLAGKTLWVVAAEGATGTLEAGTRIDLVAERRSYAVPMPPTRSVRTLSGTPRLVAAFAR